MPRESYEEGGFTSYRLWAPTKWCIAISWTAFRPSDVVVYTYYYYWCYSNNHCGCLLMMYVLLRAKCTEQLLLFTHLCK